MLKFLYLFIFVTISLYSAPTTSWYFDELGSDSYQFTVDDNVGDNEGVTYATPSVGHSSGKICSALDFRKSSTKDYVVLNKESLNGAGDFTISVWSKQSSKNGKSLLSAARDGENNELIFWFTSDVKFAGHLDGSAKSVEIPSIADDKWHHLAWRRVGTESCFFTDGVKRGCNEVTDKVLEVDSLILAQEQDSVGGKFDSDQDWEGIVDEMLIFKNQALSDDDISSIYNNQKNGKTWDGDTRSCETISMDDYSDWHLDEASWNGTTDEVKDSHGGNHGEGYDAPTVKGKLCNGVDLRVSSTSDYMKLGKDSSDNIGDFSISIWSKSESNSDSNALLSGAYSGKDNEILFWTGTSTRFSPHIHGPYQNIDISSIHDGEWHHIVWRRLGHVSCFFRDGQKEGCTDMGSFSPLHISSLILGQDQDNVGGGFDAAQDWEGLVDEVLIFRRAFTDSEIKDIYDNQNNGKNWDGSTRTCPATIMNITKSSCVISDPINSTNNPKRIPGATVRYSFEVTNSGDGKAENVLAEDTVNDEFDETTIRNLKIDGSNACNCLSPVSVNDNGADGGVSDNHVTLDFDSIVASSVECGYFEVDIQ